MEPVQETEAAEQNISEAVRNIVIDNREIPITEAPEVLKNMEASLRSDYTKKTQDVKKEREEIKAKLKADIDWFNTHDQKLWQLYMPTVEGGAGFVGTEAQLTQYDNAADDNEPEIVKPKAKRAFEQNPELKALRDRLADLEAKQAKIENETFEVGKERVLVAKDSLLKKYPNASERIVISELGTFFKDNKRHPSNVEVESIVKTIHDEITKIATRQNKGVEQTGVPTKPVTATPEASASKMVSGRQKKVMSLGRDTSDLAKSIHAQLTGGS